MCTKPIALIVDDTLQLPLSVLAEDQYTVIHVETASDALSLLQQESKICAVFIHLTASCDAALTLASTVRAQNVIGTVTLGIALSLEDEPSIAQALAQPIDEIAIRPLTATMLTYYLQKLVALSQHYRNTQLLHQLQDNQTTGLGLFAYSNGKVHAIYLHELFPHDRHALDLFSKLQEDVFALLNPAEMQDVVTAVQTYLKDHAPIDLLLNAQGSQSENRKFHLRALPMWNAQNDRTVFLARLSDITQQSNTEQALMEANQKLSSLMNAVPGGIAVYDVSAEPKVLYTNDMLRLMCGYNIEEYNQIMAEGFQKLIHPQDQATIDRIIQTFRAKPQRMEEVFRAITREGAVRWVRLTVSPVGRGKQCNAVFIDVTQDKENALKNEQMLTELYYRADHDALTGIDNRESFYRKTGELLHNNRDVPYMILVMDIDRFKIINDIYGKDVGDRILITIAKDLAAFLNQNGTCTRMESDHFAACIPQSMLDIDQIQQLFDAGLKRQQIDYHVQISYGIYTIRNIHIPINHMCDRAAMAMKTIKGNVVLRYAYYDDTLRQSMLDENAILNEMSEALELGQFVPFVQPIFTVDTQHPISVELLVRWQHPKHGLIPPIHFIPLFERNGFITKLDFYMMEQACILLQKWAQLDYRMPVSVNVSRIDLYHPHLVDHLKKLVQQYGIQPGLLRLEITESGYSKDPDELILVIEQLHTAGFMILMDDFGSGYSSLNVLMDMPVDMLKLDMRFMSKLETNPRAGSILTSVVRMAKWLHIPLIAEGVSTWEQLSFLRSIGCDSVQGYLFAKPMSINDYTALYMSPEHVLTQEHLGNEQSSFVDLSFLWDLGAQTETLFNGMIGPMGIYELQDEELEVRRVNDGYYELFRCTPKQVFDRAQEALFCVKPEDRPALLAECRKAIQSGKTQRFTCRSIHRQANHPVWLETRIRFLGKTGSHDVLCFTFSDVTEQMDFEQTRMLRNYAMVLRNVYSCVYELNMTTNHMRTIYSSCHDYQTDAKELPLESLQKLLDFLLPAGDEELTKLFFTPGYLHQKLESTGGGYYLLERESPSLYGEARWVSFTFIQIPMEPDQEVYILCVADIDSHKRSEMLVVQNQLLQNQQKQQEHYAKIMDQLGISLFEWDLTTGKMISSTPNDHYLLETIDVRQVTSYEDIELAVYEKDRSVFRQYMHDLLAYNSASVTLRLLEVSGAPVWCHIVCTLVAHEHGELTRCIATINQVDEDVKTRENYIDEHTRFRAFSDNFMVGLGIFTIKDGQQHILYLSNGYRKIIGYNDQEPLYDESPAYFGVHQDDLPRFQQATDTLIRTNLPFTIEYRVYHKDGTIRWLRSQNTVFPSAEHGETRIFGVIQDITEFKHAQAQQALLQAVFPVAMGLYQLTPHITVLYENGSMVAQLPAAARFALPDSHTGTTTVSVSKAEWLASLSRWHKANPDQLALCVSVTMGASWAQRIQLSSTFTLHGDVLLCCLVGLPASS